MAPTPGKIRFLLPKKTFNKKTQDPISDYTIKEIFEIMCHDEKDDDPWQFLLSLQQDALTDELKDIEGKAINKARYILRGSDRIDFLKAIIRLPPQR